MEYDHGKIQARDATGAPLPVAPVLYATNKHIAQDCFSHNKDYLACKKEDQNPRACLREGERVISCVKDVINRMDKACGKQLTAYSVCLEKHHYKYYECRTEEAALSSCSPLQSP